MEYRFGEHTEGSFLVRLKTDKRPASRVVREGKELLLEVSISEKITARELALAIRAMAQACKKEKAKHLAIDFSLLKKLPVSQKDFGELFSVNVAMANYEFVAYKNPPPEGWSFIESITFIARTSDAFREGIERGRIIGEEVNRVRTLSNTPGGDMTPEKLARAAEDAVKGLDVDVEILDVAEMRKLKMGGILGVGRGSEAPPRFIVMEWKGKSEKKPIVLVGKGITFDTGGINLKPSTAIGDMYMDMSGGAAVIGAIASAARLRIKKRVIGLIPAAENMPSGGSYRPGDVLHSMSGKTIEINNTDAEGRVVLADALTYAERYKPRAVIDVATLTGASIVALGTRCSALFSSSDLLASRLEKIGADLGERLWRFPLWKEYEDDIKGMFGDWSNTGPAGKGGAIMGAIFLAQFAKAYPWAHIDMAPRMTAGEGEYLARGATGEPMRTLVRAIELL